MTHPEILIPFSLPPAGHAKDLTKILMSDCGTNGLALLLSRHQSLIRTKQDDFSPQLPHEKWLNDWLQKHHQMSFLSYRANALGVDLHPGHWFLLRPVHLHIARNHLVLAGRRQLLLPEQEATLLFEKAKRLCNEAGTELIYGSATEWFLGANQWSDIETSTEDAASGHNIEIWSPKESKSGNRSTILAWRKLQNEIQMEWFADPIQEHREQRGEKTINGVWLSNGTTLSAKISTTRFRPVIFYTSNTDKWENLALDPADLDEPPQLIVLDQLSAAALANDWGSWVAMLAELEHTWFKPLCAALKKRQHNQRPFSKIDLHLSNSTALLSIEASSNALYKFWRVPHFRQFIS